MKKLNLWFFTFIINPLLNILPLFLVDIFYENQTGLGYLHHHLFLFLAWALCTTILTYYYSSTIWNYYHLPYSKKIHALFHIGMFIACCIPYKETYGIYNDLHVWLSILCIAGYIIEWVKFAFHPLYMIDLSFKKWLLGIFAIFGLATFPFLSFGSVISFGELLYSFLQPIYFYCWISSIEASKSPKCR